ncbi:MAG: hypothetical protein GY906_38735 [bacterium]|nr:hypothetical protein [bacterium]
MKKGNVTYQSSEGELPEGYALVDGVPYCGTKVKPTYQRDTFKQDRGDVVAKVKITVLAVDDDGRRVKGTRTRTITVTHELDEIIRRIEIALFGESTLV